MSNKLRRLDFAEKLGDESVRRQSWVAADAAGQLTRVLPEIGRTAALTLGLSVDDIEARVDRTDRRDPLTDTRSYAVEGSRGRLLATIEMASCTTILETVYGEREPTSILSPIESHVVDVAIARILAEFTPLCGDPIEVTRCAEAFETFLFRCTIVGAASLAIDVLEYQQRRPPSNPLDVARIPVVVDALIPIASVGLEALGALRCGDVFPLDPAIIDGVTLRVDEAILGYGRLGDANGFRATQILRVAGKRI